MLGLFLQVLCFGLSLSASYKITAEIFDAGAAQSSSASYRLLYKARGSQIRIPASANFIFSMGFLKSAFFSRQVILAPIVTGVTPGSGINTGLIEITNLAGANFLAGASVKLVKSGQPDIAAAGVSVVNSGKITCTFDLTGAAAGFWGVTVVNTNGRSGTLPAAFEISHAAPTIISITPDKGANDGVLDIVNLSGTNFRSGAKISLSKTGESDILAENIVVASLTKMTCQFNLLGKAIGLWDVNVTNDDGQSASLSQGFKIEAPDIRVIGTVVSTQNPFNPGTGPTSFRYTLSKDADITLYVYNMRGERIWQRFYPAGSVGGQVGLNEVVWDGMTDFRSVVSFGVCILEVTTKEKGKLKKLSRTKIAVIK